MKSSKLAEAAVQRAVGGVITVARCGLNGLLRAA